MTERRQSSRPVSNSPPGGARERVLLFKTESSALRDHWVDVLRSELGDLRIRVWPDSGDLDAVEYALVWDIPGEVLAGCRNLKIIFSLGAGVDHLLSDVSKLPADIPIVRMVDESLTAGMVEYVVYHCLRYHRRLDVYEMQQQRRIWEELPQTPTRECTVGVMGMGQLGLACANSLLRFGFKVSGWSRSKKQQQAITCYAGDEELTQFFAALDILVCLLPLTRQTRGILNARNFDRMKKGVFVINAARGGHLIEKDLLASIESGQVEAAALDVFNIEPLPQGHAFWRHPKITLTPHVASLTNPQTAVRRIADQIERHRRGESLEHVIDTQREY